MTMKTTMTVLAASVMAVWLAGCSATGGSGSGVSADGRVGAVLDVAKAVTVSEDELKNASLQLRAAEDKQARLAPANNKYAQRLARLTARHVNEDGMKLNFKVYLSPQVNANATPDGSIRVYSGIMDLMTDDEMRGIIGHEIGHVKLGHSLSQMRTAYMASAGRKAAASSSNVGGVLAASELGALGEAMINSQFSQSQETASDDYGLAFMKKHGYNVKAMESAFRKLDAQRNGKKGSAMDNMLATHPDPGARADRMRNMASK